MSALGAPQFRRQVASLGSVERIMLRVISQITLMMAVITGVAIPLYIPVQSAMNFRRAKKGQTYTMLKDIGSLVAWVIVSYGMFYMLFVIFYSAARAQDRQAAERGQAKWLIIFSVIYVLIGCGLALWVRRKAKAEIYS